jgi:hypothetical protein
METVRRENRLCDNLCWAGLLVAAPVLATIVVASIMIFFGLRAIQWAPIGGYALVYGLYCWQTRDPIMVVLSVAVTVVCLGAAAVFYDVSCDGRIHFQEQIIQITEGWNFRESIPVTPQWWGFPWANTYPTALPMYAAAMFKLTGNMQCGKAYTFLFLYSSFCTLLACLINTCGPRLFSLTIALVISLNPICIGQLWTFYLDGAGYLLAVTAASCLRMVFLKKVQTPSLLFALTSMSLLPCMKISFFLYSLFLFIPLVCIYRRNLAYLGAVAAPFALVFFFVGQLPYFTRPFPVVARVVASAVASVPELLSKMPVPLALAKSYFLAGDPSCGVLSFRLPSFPYRVRYDTGYGMYGSAFAFLWIFSLLASLFTLSRRFAGKRLFLWYVLFVCVIVPGTIPNLIDQRIYPVQYLFPPLVLVCLFLAFEHRRTSRAVLTGLVLCLLVTPVGNLLFVTANNYVMTRAIARRLDALGNTKGRYCQVEFQSTFLNPFWTRYTRSDRLWLLNKGGAYYISNHITNAKECEERFRVGVTLLRKSFDPTVTKGPPRSIKLPLLAGRSKILKVSCHGETVDEVALRVTDAEEGEFPNGFDARFLRVADETDGVLFDIPPYARAALLEVSSRVSLSGLELRDVTPPSDACLYTARAKDRL